MCSLKFTAAKVLLYALAALPCASIRDDRDQLTQDVHSGRAQTTWRAVGSGLTQSEYEPNAADDEISATDNGPNPWYFQSQDFLSSQPHDAFGWSIDLELGHSSYDSLGEPPLRFPDLVIRCKKSPDSTRGLTLALWDAVQPWARRQHTA
eukprot:CAMPEP_0172191644 /NCGR_PEP_ID=MMETSP1050-20130122/23833_1 /TAXON_ID=233186 /ORGANISM="Cryptomonas curvata, Strain CCAP979/52" /LENGTH=149 /DNA_ID=CAMNT_0012866751 /DNA_START=85 /DNA_END=530 /DNA_ORIENTATION=-